ncbi:hypothetical protein KSS87_005010 [Heliosperma pusillum]|nr:hypothetical protein KSS87_005010 [Heliosperma pusillum]
MSHLTIRQVGLRSNPSFLPIKKETTRLTSSHLKSLKFTNNISRVSYKFPQFPQISPNFQIKMSTVAAAAAPFWRTAGMTYISYSNICANLVRNCLKEPFKSEAIAREKVYYSLSKWDSGSPQKPNLVFRDFDVRDHLFTFD